MNEMATQEEPEEKKTIGAWMQQDMLLTRQAYEKRKTLLERLAEQGYPPNPILAKELALLLIRNDDGKIRFVDLGIIGIHDEKIGVITLTKEAFAEVIEKGKQLEAKK